MIKKVTDKINLSGVSSPLLPLIYCDFKYSSLETDGVYFQYDESDFLQSVFSLKNGCITLVKVGDMDASELSAFFELMGVTDILSDYKFDSAFTMLPLMKKYARNELFSDVLFLSESSKMSEYLEVFGLLNETDGDFSRWYSVFSKKINSFGAIGVYKTSDNAVVSTATATAIYENTAIVSGVFTNPLCRGKGYASECVNAVVAELFKRNISAVYLWCEEDKISFYEKLGFGVCGEIYMRKV